jgi:hypothetical protein
MQITTGSLEDLQREHTATAAARRAAMHEITAAWQLINATAAGLNRQRHPTLHAEALYRIERSEQRFADAVDRLAMAASRYLGVLQAYTDLEG